MKKKEATLDEADNSKIVKINIDKLCLDSENPRLPQSRKGVSEADLINYMLKDEGILELLGSIGELDYFPGEVVLVTEEKAPPQKYVVIEGNRRLTALKVLNNPSIVKTKKNSVLDAVSVAKHTPKEMPCVIFKTRNEVLDYLGYKHITGVEAWDALSKARYLKQLFDRTPGKNNDLKFTTLARKIGSRPDYVKKLLCGLHIYLIIEKENYYEIEDPENEIKFSLLTTALGYTGIQEFLHLNSSFDYDASTIPRKHIKEMAIWLFKKEQGVTRVGESRNLKKLSAIVADETALKEFRAGKELEDCYLISSGKEEMIVKAIRSAHTKIKIAQTYTLVGTNLDNETISVLEEIALLCNTIIKVGKK